MANPITIGALLTGASGVLSAGATIAGGAQANANSKAQAKQLRMQAAEARAIGGRRAMEERRKGRLAASRAQAVGAASGAGIESSLLADIAGRSEYLALSEQYGGESRARGLMDSASAARAAGKAALRGSYLSAAGTILSTAGKMFGDMEEPEAGGSGSGAWGMAFG